MRIYLGLFLAFFACDAYGQVRGSILDPAAPAINPMDPNGDGYITSTGMPFTGPLDQTEFELPFLPFQQFQREPGADNQYAPGCELYELITDVNADVYPGYYYFQDTDGIADNGDELIFFRFRLSRFSNGATAFSVLVDTDYRFGFDGVERDANAIQGNPGFEKEIVIFNNTGSDGGVWVWDVDGTANPSLQRFHGALATYYQVSYALNQDPVCVGRVPVFVDMYVPFSALGISSTTQVRMALVANEDIESALGGGASDIGGVDGIAMPDDDDQFIAVITNHAPVRVDQPANIAPTGVDATISIDENAANGLVLHTVSAQDANGDAVVFAITDGNTSNAFSIDHVAGTVTINNSAALDREVNSSFVLLVQASDGSLYDNAVITINLNDVNDNPPSLPNVSVDVQENAVDGMVVHTVDAIDLDASPALMYSIKGGSGAGVFDVDAQTGVIAVADANLLDFETSSSFTLLVEVSDGLYADVGEIVIRLVDENEAPSLSDANIVLVENPAAGALVYVVKGTDPDANAVLQYSIMSGDISHVFAVDNLTGEIKVNDASGIDFETRTSFSLNVLVSDGTFTDHALIIVNITNVNEAPMVTSASITLEDFQENDIIHAVMASDPDAGDVLSYTMEAVNFNEAFTIDIQKGEIAIVDADVLPLVTTQVQLFVTATDPGGLSGQGLVDVTFVRPPNEGIKPEKGFSPNGDSLNDFWLIRGIEAFPNNHVKVFNRWGHLIFEASGYDNNLHRWQGEVSGDSAALENTYFFIITAAALQPMTGYVIVKP